jgi:hypothetical protein
MSVRNAGSMWIRVPQSCLKFDDVNQDYVDCGTDSLLALSGNISICCWMYIDPGRDDAYASYISRCDVGGGNNNYILQIDSDNEFRFQWFTAGAWRGQATVNIYQVPSSQWTHVMGTYSADTDTVALYVNGDLIVSDTEIHGPTAQPTAHTYIGYKDGTSFVNGRVHSVQLWSGVALTTDQVKQVYNGIDVETSKRVGYWKCNDREDTTVEDSGTGGNDGTLTSESWGNVDIRCWNTRFDISNYDVVIETFLEPTDRHFLFRNIIPGAIREYSNPLGWVINLDETYRSANTLIFEPISGYGLSGLRSSKTVLVKSANDTFITKDYFGIKLECKEKKDWSDWS